MPRIIDQFGRKRCQKKRKDVGYKLIKEFFQKKIVAHEQWAVKNSFITLLYLIPYVCNERIFDRLQFPLNKFFLNKLRIKFVVHYITLHLVLFASKSINCSSLWRSEKILVWHSFCFRSVKTSLFTEPSKTHCTLYLTYFLLVFVIMIKLCISFS